MACLSSPIGLVNDAALEALRHWMATPGSDVEKSLKRSMRARHSHLDQATRRGIAARVLGVAVARGRLVHVVQREIPSGGNDAAVLLAVFLAQNAGVFGCSGDGPFDCVDSRIATAARAPLFRVEESPTAPVRLAAAWSLPLWLATRWVEELGVLHAFLLGRAMSTPARVTLRVNTLKGGRLSLLNAFHSEGVFAVPTAESPWGVWLPDGRPPGGGVWQLPGFSDGLFEVQDEGSQLIVLSTEARPGEIVLDYCAGRGGKTWALASMIAPNGKVRAWDIDAELRRQLAGSRLGRAGASGLVDVATVRPGAEQPVATVDVVLVDAPCSSCGALRRHPSQRWALNEADVVQLTRIQLQVLQEAADLVRPGGRLVYATCSLLHAENAGVADAFQAVALEFEPWPFLDRPGRGGPSHHRTLMPHIEGTDGFFMSRWKRRDVGSDRAVSTPVSADSRT